MQYTARHPKPLLRRHVECFWSLEGAAQPACVERVLPDGCVEWIVQVGDPWSRLVEGPCATLSREPQPRVFVAGQLSRYLLLEPGSHVRTFGVRFRPGGAALLTGGGVDALTNRQEPIENVLDVAGVELTERLLLATDDATRQRLVEAFLQARLGPFPEDARVDAVIATILRNAAGASVAQLADAVGLSRRQLERRFASRVGLSPKAFARTMRFQGLFRMLRDEAGPRFADLALAAGYFDQAHLSRDFREFSGQAPRQLLVGQGEVSTHFTSADPIGRSLRPLTRVAFLQDEGRPFR